MNAYSLFQDIHCSLKFSIPNVLLRPRHIVHGQIYLQADDDGGQLEFTYVTAKGDLGLSHWNARWNHEKKH